MTSLADDVEIVPLSDSVEGGAQEVYQATASPASRP